MVYTPQEKPDARSHLFLPPPKITWIRFNGYFSASYLKHPRKDGLLNKVNDSKGKEILLDFEKAPDFEFEKPVIIVGGGHVDEVCLNELLARGYGLVAADGGANQFYHTTITPDLIVGDMDSLKHVDDWRTRTKVLEQSDQNNTDFEKCLASTMAPLYIGLGLLGKRFDHSLAAMHALARFAPEKNILLVDETDVIYAARGVTKISLKNGTRVSIYPFGKITFQSSKGLEYPLNGLVMEQGVQIGTSNEANADLVEIVPEQSDAIYKLIVAKQFLDAVIKTALAN